MTRTFQNVLIGSFFWLLGGCVINGNPAGDNPFEGTYNVTSHTRNETDCTAPGPDVIGEDSFFSLKEETVFGTKILGYRTCTDATTCETDFSLFESFIDEGKGWMRQVKTTSGTTTCALGLVEGPLVETDTGLSLDTKTSKATIMLSASESCDLDLVDSRRSELVCTAIESLEADKQ